MSLDIDPKAIWGKSRKKEIVRKRQIICYVLSDSFNHGPSEIGRTVNRDHSTVIHSIETVKRDMKISAEIDELAFQAMMQARRIMGILPNHTKDVAREAGPHHQYQD